MIDQEKLIRFPSINRTIPAHGDDVYEIRFCATTGVCHFAYTRHIEQENLDWRRIRKAIIESYLLWEHFPTPDTIIQIRSTLE